MITGVLLELQMGTCAKSCQVVADISTDVCVVREEPHRGHAGSPVQLECSPDGQAAISRESLCATWRSLYIPLRTSLDSQVYNS